MYLFWEDDSLIQTLGFRGKEKGAHGKEVYGRELPSLGPSWAPGPLCQQYWKFGSGYTCYTPQRYVNPFLWVVLCHPLQGLAIWRVAVCQMLIRLVGWVLWDSLQHLRMPALISISLLFPWWSLWFLKPFCKTLQYESKEAVQFSKLNSRRIKFCCPTASVDTVITECPWCVVS